MMADEFWFKTMPRKKPTIAEQNQRRALEGRGSGTGADFLPWVTCHDFHSRGVRVRARCALTGRMHFLLSNLEFTAFIWLLSDPTVTDIQEQYPLLPLKATLAIAEELKLVHSGLYQGDDPTVMTTDFLVTRQADGRETKTAYTVKKARAAQSHHFKRKFRIEERFWQNVGVSLKTLTEHDLPFSAVRSAEWILQAGWPYFLADVSFERRLEIAGEVAVRCAGSEDMLADVAAQVDADLGLEDGTGLDVVRWMLVERRWVVQPGELPFPDQPLRLAA
ncbi:MAG: TnsA endonuclease N-terminal domain-containing protein [Opitutaceae bacterium]|nr:TnsA endonuclease N-terminal domain-containing protein [Opitutaceae bacterium]